MKNIIYILALLHILISCNKYPYEVEEALILSGDNRVELEKVLIHCKRQNQIAYESACFLIGNMKFHKSKEEIILDSTYKQYFIMIDSIYQMLFRNMNLDDIKLYKTNKYDSLRLSLAERFNALSKLTSNPLHNISDLQTLKADYLIDNIESALQIWTENNYTYKKDFDFFKEFILPYRTTDEHPIFRRSDIRKMYNYILSDIHNNSTITTLERYKVYVDKCRWINKYIIPKKHLGIYDLQIPKFNMDCHNMTTWSNNILRACGIPTVYEFTPKWVDRDSRHFWCVSPDSTAILQPYTAPDNNFREDWESDIKYAGKVYRKTYGAHQNTPYFFAGTDEFIPEILNSPLLLDQTYRYHQTITLRIPLNHKVENKVAYLGMFTATNEITPVGWGFINHKKNEITFEQVPLNTLFFPICYDNETMVNIAEPFIIHSSEATDSIPLISKTPANIRDISLINKELFLTKERRKKVDDLQYLSLPCDTMQKQQLHVLRKYPEKRRMRNFHEKLLGACLLGGDNERGKYDTIFTLKDVPFPYLQEIVIENTKKYRYYRFCTVNGEPVNIAHMEFLGPYSSGHTCLSPTPLPIFSPKDQNRVQDPLIYRIHGTPLRTGSKPEHAFDNNFNTYAGSTGIGMDFKTPVQITQLRFIPRNANNMIVPGNSYLLMYYDKGWQEHGILYAENNYLVFDHVPTATLYWLRNLTEGKEELPFFYFNGKQHFLHMDDIPLKTKV